MDKVWLKSYPEDIPATLPPAPFRSLRDLFEQAFDAWPERPAFTNMGTTLTYRQLDELSMHFACPVDACSELQQVCFCVRDSSHTCSCDHGA